MNELILLAEKLKIYDRTIFLKNLSSDARLLLLEHTDVLLYTPDEEHFGIVPIEAMYMKCIVFACNSGGPKETIGYDSEWLDDGQVKRGAFLLKREVTVWAK